MRIVDVPDFFTGDVDICERLVSALQFCADAPPYQLQCSIDEVDDLFNKGPLYKGMIDLEGFEFIDQVLYLLQKFSEFNERVEIINTPICVEGSDIHNAISSLASLLLSIFGISMSHGDGSATGGSFECKRSCLIKTLLCCIHDNIVLFRLSFSENGQPYLSIIVLSDRVEISALPVSSLTTATIRKALGDITASTSPSFSTFSTVAADMEEEDNESVHISVVCLVGSDPTSATFPHSASDAEKDMLWKEQFDDLLLEFAEQAAMMRKQAKVNYILSLRRALREELAGGGVAAAAAESSSNINSSSSSSIDINHRPDTAQSKYEFLQYDDTVGLQPAEIRNRPSTAESKTQARSVNVDEIAAAASADKTGNITSIIRSSSNNNSNIDNDNDKDSGPKSSNASRPTTAEVKNVYQQRHTQLENADDEKDEQQQEDDEAKEYKDFKSIPSAAKELASETTTQSLPVTSNNSSSLTKSTRGPSSSAQRKSKVDADDSHSQPIDASTTATFTAFPTPLRTNEQPGTVEDDDEDEENHLLDNTLFAIDRWLANSRTQLASSSSPLPRSSSLAPPPIHANTDNCPSNSDSNSDADGTGKESGDSGQEELLMKREENHSSPSSSSPSSASPIVTAAVEALVPKSPYGPSKTTTATSTTPTYPSIASMSSAQNLQQQQQPPPRPPPPSAPPIRKQSQSQPQQQHITEDDTVSDKSKVSGRDSDSDSFAAPSQSHDQAPTVSQFENLPPVPPSGLTASLVNELLRSTTEDKPGGRSGAERRRERGAAKGGEGGDEEGGEEEGGEGDETTADYAMRAYNAIRNRALQQQDDMYESVASLPHAVSLDSSSSSSRPVTAKSQSRPYTPTSTTTTTTAGVADMGSGSSSSTNPLRRSIPASTHISRKSGISSEVEATTRHELTNSSDVLWPPVPAVSRPSTAENTKSDGNLTGKSSLSASLVHELLQSTTMDGEDTAAYAARAYQAIRNKMLRDQEEAAAYQSMAASTARSTNNADLSTTVTAAVGSAAFVSGAVDFEQQARPSSTSLYMPSRPSTANRVVGLNTKVSNGVIAPTEVALEGRPSTSQGLYGIRDSFILQQQQQQHHKAAQEEEEEEEEEKHEHCSPVDSGVHCTHQDRDTKQKQQGQGKGSSEEATEGNTSSQSREGMTSSRSSISSSKPVAARGAERLVINSSQCLSSPENSALAGAADRGGGYIDNNDDDDDINSGSNSSDSSNNNRSRPATAQHASSAATDISVVEGEEQQRQHSSSEQYRKEQGQITHSAADAAAAHFASPENQKRDSNEKLFIETHRIDELYSQEQQQQPFSVNNRSTTAHTEAPVSLPHTTTRNNDTSTYVAGYNYANNSNSIRGELIECKVAPEILAQQISAARILIDFNLYNEAQKKNAKRLAAGHAVLDILKKNQDQLQNNNLQRQLQHPMFVVDQEQQQQQQQHGASSTPPAAPTTDIVPTPPILPHPSFEKNSVGTGATGAGIAGGINYPTIGNSGSPSSSSTAAPLSSQKQYGTVNSANRPMSHQEVLQRAQAGTAAVEIMYPGRQRPPYREQQQQSHDHNQDNPHHRSSNLHTRDPQQGRVLGAERYNSDDERHHHMNSNHHTHDSSEDRSGVGSGRSGIINDKAPNPSDVRSESPKRHYRQPYTYEEHGHEQQQQQYDPQPHDDRQEYRRDQPYYAAGQSPQHARVQQKGHQQQDILAEKKRKGEGSESAAAWTIDAAPSWGEKGKGGRVVGEGAGVGVGVGRAVNTQAVMVGGGGESKGGTARDRDRASSAGRSVTPTPTPAPAPAGINGTGGTGTGSGSGKGSSKQLTNFQQTKNAISFVCLAGVHMDAHRVPVLSLIDYFGVLSKSTGARAVAAAAALNIPAETMACSYETAITLKGQVNQFVIMFYKSKILAFKGIYAVDPNNNAILLKLYGKGPRELTDSNGAIKEYLKFDSSSKSFKTLPVNSLSGAVDGLILERPSSGTTTPRL